ncbi:GntR family transcriptional regulator [Enterococcus cecorum]|uniref:GntR family transcriptional regulator n=1 Tax=Enterococcus cecorum TaxID=44008 RepID=UPI000B25343D|nr:GntR family transcriptional regulator [Enterococcus cecorum]MBM6935981.1 GntR family transcriptional regulator [Enterococcus cecorum]MDZ5501826.1 GntR family transcriptional regulator [Enterococcus cecorum]MDZ5555676.1 GntR family transcriptional regulator [Enterococcus cecorum]MDZ5557597.1 GntR family transcriptional regulator [Enterococcus cecorum]MDZ5590472.1 GntR family transcriptional regulator [Enterococcus cecorum]
MPKYEEIANILRERILNGTYPVDSFLPHQTELVKEFNVSRMTIKKAVNILTVEGLVYSKQGMGTKILNSSFWDKDDDLYRFNQYQGLTSDFKNDERTLTSQVILFTVIFPSEEIAQRLAVDTQTPIYQIIRLRLVDNQPFVLEHTYMPCDLVPGLSREILQNSIYSYIQDELKINFAGSYRHITAEKPDEYDQKYLHCELTDPVLQVEQVVYLENGRPIEYSRSRNRYDSRGYSLLDVKK